jgi:hypothetical protein
LTVVDKGYFDATLLLGIERGQDRHWLTRARFDLRATVVIGPRPSSI